jgi:hypothetical protein
MPGTKSNPREIDYLAYVNDEHSSALNDWEAGFVKSCIAWLRRSPTNRLSSKQVSILIKFQIKFKLADDPYCIHGYADRTDTESMNDVGPGSDNTKDRYASRGHAAANDKVDDYDDDIPF